jgi:hypothetical protein
MKVELHSLMMIICNNEVFYCYDGVRLPLCGTVVTNGDIPQMIRE